MDPKIQAFPVTTTDAGMANLYQKPRLNCLSTQLPSTQLGLISMLFIEKVQRTRIQRLRAINSQSRGIYWNSCSAPLYKLYILLYMLRIVHLTTRKSRPRENLFYFILIET